MWCNWMESEYKWPEGVWLQFMWMSSFPSLSCILWWSTRGAKCEVDNQSLFIVSILIASESMQYDIGIDSMVHVLTPDCDGMWIVGRRRCIDDWCAMCTAEDSTPSVCLWRTFIQSGRVWDGMGIWADDDGDAEATSCYLMKGTCIWVRTSGSEYACVRAWFNYVCWRRVEWWELEWEIVTPTTSLFFHICIQTHPFFLLFVLHMSPINPHLQKHRNMVRKGIESEKWGEKWEEGLMGGWNGTFRRVWNDKQSMYVVSNTMLWPYGSCRVNRDSCDSSFLVVLLSSLHSVLHTGVIAIHFDCDWGGLNWESRQSVINRGKPSKTILLR